MGTGGSYPARELVVLISSVDHAKPHLLSSAGQQAGPASRGPTPKVEVVGSSPVSRAIDIPGRESQEPDLERVKSIVAVAPNPAGATATILIVELVQESDHLGRVRLPRHHADNFLTDDVNLVEEDRQQPAPRGAGLRSPSLPSSSPAAAGKALAPLLG